MEKKRKKILIFIEVWKPFIGGGQIFTEYLINGLVKNHNYSVTMITRKLRINDKIYDSNEINKGHLEIYRLGYLTKIDSIIGKLSWIFHSFFFAFNISFSLIHSMPNLGALPGKLLSSIKKKPIVFSIQGSTYQLKTNRYNFVKRIKNYFLKIIQLKINYDCVITDNSQLIQLFPKKRKAHFITNGVDINKFYSLNKKRSKFKIISVGRLHPQKGFLYLIKSLQYVVKNNNNIELSIIGSGNQLDRLTYEVRKLSLEKYIKFLGDISYEKLPKYYSNSDLFVLPSLFEGQPLSLLEAWASSLPVLVTDCGENINMVKNNINGWIVPSKNAYALSDKLNHILSLPSKTIKQVGANGRDLVTEKYGWDTKINLIQDIYKKHIKKN